MVVQGESHPLCQLVEEIAGSPSARARQPILDIKLPPKFAL